MNELQLSDLSLLFSMGELTKIFAAFMTLIFVATVIALCYHFVNFRTRVRAVNALLENQSKDNLAINRQDTLERAMSHHRPEVGKLWREFDESLVFSGDRKKLFNTLDAEHFFNARTLATGLTESRLLAAAPSFLVAVGVLGTFVGLSLGLADLHLGNDLDQLRADMEKMISGASTAFNTSIIGVFLSLVVNFGEKSLERRVRRTLLTLQQRIDFLYPRIPAEQSLVEIAVATQSASDSLLELHERIGDRLQESIEGISQAMQEAVTDALNKVMAPALDSLVKSASDQSTVALEQLVGSFMDKFGEAGREHGAAMDRVAENVTSAMTGVQAQLDRVFESIEASRADSEVRVQELNKSAVERERALSERFNDMLQSVARTFEDQERKTSVMETERQERLNALVADMASKHSDMLQSINQATSNTIEANNQLIRDLGPLAQRVSEAAVLMGESSEHMTVSARELGELGRQARAASEALATSIHRASEEVNHMASGSSEVAEQISRQLGLMETVRGELAVLSDSLKEAATLAQDGFADMTKAQGQFLDGVKVEFSKLGQSLAEQVAKVEKQASDWLQEYHSRVSGQVADRMEKWDQASRRYADQMVSVVETISGIVDEIEAKVE